MPRTNVVDAAVLSLRRLITADSYGPGARLPSERELAEALDASRPAIREALRQLSKSGLLETRRGSGTYVASIDLSEVFALRLLLEPYAAACAAERRSPADLAVLRALVRELRASMADAVVFSDVDGRIHRLVAQAAGNRLLVTSLGQLDELTRVSRLVTSGDVEARRETVQQMRRLAGAVGSRRADDAAEVMRGHLEALQARAAVRTDRLDRIRELAAG
jgi:GntR family transcriptional repressor for pyruvate dehydrogenase complex